MDDSDPRPQPPEKPLPGDCCDSGCECCVMDTYADQLEAYRERLVAWQQRHPESGVEMVSGTGSQQGHR